MGAVELYSVRAGLTLTFYTRERGLVGIKPATFIDSIAFSVFNSNSCTVVYTYTPYVHH